MSLLARGPAIFLTGAGSCVERVSFITFLLTLMQRDLSHNHLMQMFSRPNSANPETEEVHLRFEYELLYRHYNPVAEIEMIISDEENWGEKYQRRADKDSRSM